MPASKSVAPTPTHTSVILETLVAADDLVTASNVRQLTGLRIDVVLVTLKHLRKYKAVQSMAEDDVVYWFATPHDDTRKFKHDETRHEDEPRRNNKQGTVRPSRDLPRKRGV